MKVIKPGRKQKGWAEEFTCTGKGNGNGGCTATLLVEHGDLYNTYSHALHETDTFVTFRCAACGVQTDITNYRGPKLISHLVDGGWG
jgi:hypothetical protein